MLRLTFFGDDKEGMKAKEASLKNIIQGDIVATAVGSGGGRGSYLFVGDSLKNVVRIDKKMEAQAVQVDLETIEYIQASRHDQTVLVAGPATGGYNVCLFDSKEFERSLSTIMTSDLTISPTLLSIPGVTQTSRLFCASPSLGYVAFLSSGDSVVVAQVTNGTIGKPVVVRGKPDVVNMFVSDSGFVFLCTTSGVYAFPSETNHVFELDSAGCTHDMCFATHGDKVGVFRDGILIFYEAKRPASVIKTRLDLSSEGVPKRVGFVGNYVFAVYPYEIQGNKESIKLLDPVYMIMTAAESLREKVSFVELQWGALLLVLEDKTIRMTGEIDDRKKVEKLCDSSHFDKALLMAQTLHMADDIVAEIHKRKGDADYLVQKYDDAMDEYVQTLRFTEPSNIIRKFVEPHHAQNLMKYLLALQQGKLATKHHTTLLFNCYTKTRAQDQLREAVEKYEREASEDPNAGPSFDVETAVDVLKRNGYKEYAERLARAYGQHSLYIRLLHESQKFEEILTYMHTLPGELVKANLIEYGSEIMDRYEDGRERLTEFAVHCCTEGVVGRRRGRIIIDSHELAMIFVNSEKMHFQFLYKVFQACKAANMDISESNWNVLVEMALRSGSDVVMSLLADEDAKYSNEQVLVYLTAFKHKEGKMFVYERMGLVSMILQEARPEECLLYCKKYGAKDQTLWSDALVKLSRAECEPSVLAEFLEEVQRQDALPFLTVLRVMSAAQKHSFATLLPIVQMTFKREQELLHQAEQQIEEANQRTAENREVVHAISTQNYVINQKKCEFCQQVIDSEANHFMCGHSFHLRCLGDVHKFCRICKDGFEKVLEEKRKKIDSATNNGSETTQETTGDGFQFLLRQIGDSLFASGLDLTSSVQRDDETEDLLAQMASQH